MLHDGALNPDLQTMQTLTLPSEETIKQLSIGDTFPIFDVPTPVYTEILVGRKRIQVELEYSKQLGMYFDELMLVQLRPREST